MLIINNKINKQYKINHKVAVHLRLLHKVLVVHKIQTLIRKKNFNLKKRKNNDF
jgi:hypothetical protein